MENKHFSMSDAFAFAYKYYFDNLLYFLYLFCIAAFFIFIVLALPILLIILAFNIFPSIPLFSKILPHLYHFFDITFILPLYTRAYLDIYETGRTNSGSWKSSFHLWPIVVVASFVYLLMVLIGTIFLIIPGLYVLIRYYFYVFGIIDKKLGIFDAFALSVRLTQGVQMKLLLFIFISVVAENILGIGGIGDFISMILIGPFFGLAET